ncbi:Taurine catabolism dioxygenase TauD, TfdA family [Frateuria aurantia DSM 6220]|uniref:Taurine catabolism dioxygenase TauD, TfdA family n=2 Tax=Frateuria aurantia TaxID=81475 RepID=H8L5V4_FRAAD|nr:Taurine catabolism dioxygenase TauD, TfdA family [Frateuria aurantia DSM 6220]
MRGNPLGVCLSALDHPDALGATLRPEIEALLAQANVSLHDIQQRAWTMPLIHLRSAFEVGDLPETPAAFIPVPDDESTIAARACSIACLAVLNSDTISYGSENDGHLFVNLVPFRGEGEMAEKSKGSMRGHTDAVYFPVRGQLHELDKRIAPSPDFVCLSGLRNPDQIATTVMPLSVVLSQLSKHDIKELTKPQYVIRPQKTFTSGLKLIFGDTSPLAQPMKDIQLLFEAGDGYWIRYSHSASDSDYDSEAATSAAERFEQACLTCSTAVVIAPGDILIVNNRLGLHGRGVVGGEAGGTSRWLLRTYGLDTRKLNPAQRYLDSPYKLFP